MGNPAAGVSAVSPKPALKTADHLYAEAVFRKWITHLRELPERHRLLQSLLIKPELAEKLVDELITAANRLNVPERLEQALLARQDSSSKREHLAMRQVLRAQTVLRDLISWLGYIGLPEQDRPTCPVSRRKLFVSTTQLDEAGLPALEPTPIDTNNQYVTYWLAGLIDLVKNNAGHTAGSDITLEQNLALGRIIEQFRQA